MYKLVSCITAVMLINLVHAQHFPIVNPVFTWVDGENAAPERYGNYDDVNNTRRFFPIGHYDQEANLHYNALGLDASSYITPGPETTSPTGNYRSTMGPVNIIRVSHNNLHSFADIATRQPFKFMVTLPTQLPLSNVTVAQLTTVISNAVSVLGNDNILGWYTRDEPNSTTITSADFYAFNSRIRTAEINAGVTTPKEILVIFASLSSTGDPTVNLNAFASDPNVTMVGIDRYPYNHGEDWHDVQENLPYPDADLSGAHELSGWIDVIHDWMITTGNSKPILSIIQGNAHQNYIPHGTSYNRNWYKRVPSYSESRYQAFSSISSGASGIVSWAARTVYCHPNGDNRPAQNPTVSAHTDPLINTAGLSEQAFFEAEENAIFGNLRLVYQELDVISEILINGIPVDNLLSWQINDPAALNYEPSLRTLCYKEEGTNTYTLIAVNSNDQTQTGSTTMEDLDDVVFRLLDDDLEIASVTNIDPFDYSASANHDAVTAKTASAVTHSAKSFNDSFEPGEVHIYRIIIVPARYELAFNTDTGAWITPREAITGNSLSTGYNVYSGSYIKHMVVGNFDNDPEDEIAYNTDGGCWITIRDMDGTSIGSGWNANSFGPIKFMISGNFDSDPEDELAFNFVGVEQIIIRDGDGSLISSIGCTDPRFSLTHMVKGNFDSDVEDEIACNVNGGSYIFIYNGDGSLCETQWQVYSGSSVSHMTVGNFDDDIEDELVFNTDTGAWITIRNSDGSSIGPGWNVYSGSTISRMIVGNFDSDSEDEIAFNTDTGAWITVRNSDGTSIASGWNVYPSCSITHMIAADFNDNGRDDLAFNTDSGDWITVKDAITGNDIVPGAPTGYNVYGSSSIAHMVAGNFQTGNLLSKKANTQSNQMLSAIPRKDIIVINPVINHVEFKINCDDLLQDRVDALIEIYDAKANKLISTDMALSASFKVDIPFNNLANGMYYYQIVAGAKKYTGAFIKTE